MSDNGRKRRLQNENENEKKEDNLFSKITQIAELKRLVTSSFFAKKSNCKLWRKKV